MITPRETKEKIDGCDFLSIFQHFQLQLSTPYLYARTHCGFFSVFHFFSLASFRLSLVLRETTSRMIKNCLQSMDTLFSVRFFLSFSPPLLGYGTGSVGNVELLEWRKYIWKCFFCEIHACAYTIDPSIDRPALAARPLSPSAVPSIAKFQDFRKNSCMFKKSL